ncbi:Flavin carrier protein 1 [Colletotrichum truncatum]|uniref:Flavin carrier protein 1 n=1 Tax=Colletotrichum truncatum TaxID=5467 RepID=A0ACC3ZG97_COLTU|nr:Flavin carrier protein 1 [Colletotrichum truncatum]KAF6802011.1 Flavin carrier protein 1 [Colletotrichum truncatum]
MVPKPIMLILLSCLGSLLASASAQQMLVSNSLNTCQDDSSFTASRFKFVFTPNNGSASIDIAALSTYQGNIVFDASISVYGYNIFQKTIDPCDESLKEKAGLCPMNTGKIGFPFQIPVPKEVVSQIPSIAYNIPDLDATVRVYLNKSGTTDSVACIQTNISNGKTVDLIGVKWAAAAIVILGLLASALVSGLGHSNTAAHVATYTVSLLGYFQAQAIIGLTGVRLPPIVQAWTQDLQWSMGIIRVQFMQDIFTWYQRATGGTPARILDSLASVSVQVQKRSTEIGSVLNGVARRSESPSSVGSYVVFGIQRVAFRAKIESTNVFMTSLTFCCISIVFTALCVAASKGFCELAIRSHWVKNDKFLEFRNGWLVILKGLLYRITLLSFPPLTVFCLWEFTRIDSPAEVVLAVFFFFGAALTLLAAAFKIILIARRSIALHRNPAYMLFSNPQILNKLGFLYVQFRGSAYYFVLPAIGYIIIKGAFISFSQTNNAVQTIALVIIEFAALIAASVMRPWMDKSTNIFNISIFVMNVLNSLMLLIFTNIFGTPASVIGVVGVVFFVGNAVFSLILLLFVVISSTIIFFRKNPDARYKIMADDRHSFMKSQVQTKAELDSLAIAARGEKQDHSSASLPSASDLDAQPSRDLVPFDGHGPSSCASPMRSTSSHSQHKVLSHSGGRL